MQDQAPRNRAERRHPHRTREPRATLVLPQRPQPPQPRSQNAPHGPDTGTGAPSAEEEAEMAESQPSQMSDFTPAPDAPPKRSHHAKRPSSAAASGAGAAADKPPVSHKAGGSKQARIRQGLVAYYTLAGLGVARFDQMDGEIVVASAAPCADAWMAAGAANPQIMRALEMVTIAGPYMALVMAHAQLATAIMQRHGTSPLALFRSSDNTTSNSEPTGPQRGPAMPPSGSAESAPSPYQPVGANAPTDAPPPPPVYVDPGLIVIPDEGIPADIDIALRQMARQSGRPYDELRQEALVELAQIRMQSNGHMQQPGALGAPIARE